MRQYLQNIVLFKMLFGAVQSVNLEDNLFLFRGFVVILTELVLQILNLILDLLFAEIRQTGA